MRYKTTSWEQTYELAKNWAKNLKGSDIIILNGQLGAGKTVFTKGLAAGLGVKQPVLSPTFVLFRQYKGEKLDLYHFDMYRLSDSSEAIEAGFDEYIGKETAVTVIEWADKVQDILKNISYTVDITYVDDNTRLVEIK
ncbi:MAG TPA: tRNA (adenosine(37)-N6)-threonylcarbamoyltransferase complex ATPase subunit type 1 TsaE [Clostridia bacterium]